jgi:ABC-type Fe3+/spermidine/putrescine transport system ATPase subunit
LLESIQLVKSFGDVTAVRGVSLVIKPGEVVGLIGGSGSGKSTLLNLFAGLIDATEGVVTLNNERIKGPAEQLVPGHPHIKLVHQEYQLMPNVSIRENITYALRFYEKRYQDFRVEQLINLCRKTGRFVTRRAFQSPRFAQPRTDSRYVAGSGAQRKYRLPVCNP